jgi:DNA-binding CsgD family transcriptional regulator
MTLGSSLERARSAFGAEAWSDACDLLVRADREAPLGLEDLERLAVASYLVGKEMPSTEAWGRAYRAAREQGDAPRAVRSAFWAAFVLLNRGEVPGASGWVARGQRLLDLDEGSTPVVEQGYLRYLVALRSVLEGAAEAAQSGFEEAAVIGERYGDADLETLARLGQGRVLIKLGELVPGVACLDEAMVAVTREEVSQIVIGDSYCSAIEACHELFDLTRAQQWTEGLGRWCDRHPSLVAFRGQCLIHRSEVLQLRGDWPDALAEAHQARHRLSRPAGQLAIGAACYQQGEVHRLQGAFDAAEAAYQEARKHGREPQPGLAQLRLAQGSLDAAVAAIRRTLAETRTRQDRSRLLPAAVEVLLAAGDIDVARAACSELEELAEEHDSRMLEALAAQTRGAVDFADSDPASALASLRRAFELWQQLEAPYEAARVRVLLGQACSRLGDEEAAASEWATAREVLADLGASPDLARLDRLAGDHAAPNPSGLTGRELEVLRGIATGQSNRAIAAELVISHRTVERHVSNIFTKLGVSSRSEATAYAFRHGLVTG